MVLYQSINKYSIDTCTATVYMLMTKMKNIAEIPNLTKMLLIFPISTDPGPKVRHVRN